MNEPKVVVLLHFQTHTARNTFKHTKPYALSIGTVNSQLEIKRLCSCDKNVTWYKNELEFGDEVNTCGTVYESKILINNNNCFCMVIYGATNVYEPQ